MDKLHYSVNNWLVDSAFGNIVHLHTGERKRLGEYQLKLLTIMATHAGEIFTKEELTQYVWARRIVGNNSLTHAIHSLRIALEDDGKQQKIIKTVARKGYFLDATYCQQIGVEASSDLLSAASPPQGHLRHEVNNLSNTMHHSPASPCKMHMLDSVNDDYIYTSSKRAKPRFPYLNSKLSILLFTVVCCYGSNLIFSYYIDDNAAENDYRSPPTETLFFHSPVNFDKTSTKKYDFYKTLNKFNFERGR